MRALLFAAAMGAILAVQPAMADTTVRWFISETNPEQTAWQRDVARRFEAAHAGTHVEIQVMSGEPYKAKLTTMLQSTDRPHLFYSWGGGVMYAQADAGLLQDITDRLRGPWADTLSPAAVEGLSYKGRTYGAPVQLTQVALWYNRALLAKAAVDPESLRNWDGLLAAVVKLKAAGVPPFSVGGADKWPLNMFWSGLALRIGGQKAFTDAMGRTGSGFDGPDFLRASEMFKQLIDLAPFQRGFLGDTAPQAAGQFGDGKAALQVMGNWFHTVQRTQSAGQKGVPDEDLGVLPFPQVPGGRGDASDVVGGINGFLVTKGAPPEAVEFLRYYTSPDVQREAAKKGLYIPAARSLSEDVANPYFRQISASLQGAKYVQNFYDQMLGPNTGRVMNDTSADLAAGRITPAQVGKQIQDSWELDR